ncbi:hypothetical protein [Rhodovulum sp. MB263]|uniref:hypothetical protein n=1 Tax=Rhodovulum sp. (strain MB263) TaxID=308754 RepID=UPI0035117EE1
MAEPMRPGAGVARAGTALLTRPVCCPPQGRRLPPATGLDVSGCVDAGNDLLQRDGLAPALLRPEMQAAFRQIPRHRSR